MEVLLLPHIAGLPAGGMLREWPERTPGWGCAGPSTGWDRQESLGSSGDLLSQARWCEALDVGRNFFVFFFFSKPWGCEAW